MNKFMKKNLELEYKNLMKCMYIEWEKEKFVEAFNSIRYI